MVCSSVWCWRPPEYFAETEKETKNLTVGGLFQAFKRNKMGLLRGGAMVQAGDDKTNRVKKWAIESLDD